MTAPETSTGDRSTKVFVPVRGWFASIARQEAQIQETFLVEWLNYQDEYEIPVAYPLTEDPVVWRIATMHRGDFITYDVIEEVTSIVHKKSPYLGWFLSGRGRRGSYTDARIWMPSEEADWFWMQWDDSVRNEE